MGDKPALNQKGRYQLQYRGIECLNCGHPLDMSDRYCPNCSQANSTKKLSIKDFFDEFFGSVLSYDSKILRTLAAFLFRPGKITRDYINGKRVTYTNPFRFLLSLAIIYFLMLSVGGDFSTFDNFGGNMEGGTAEVKKGLLNLKINGDEEYKKEVSGILDSIPDLTFIDEIQKKKDSSMQADPKAYYNGLKEKSSLDRFFNKSELFGWLLNHGKVKKYDDLQAQYDLPVSFENRYAFNVAKSWIKIKNQPSTFINSLISKLPFTTFFFLPVFTIVIWLIYIRKKYTYTDHLIFSFHVTSLLFILLIISYLIDTIFNRDSAGIFLTIFSVYLFVAMRKFYQQNVFKTIVKYLFLNTIFFILACIAIVVLSAGSIITY